MPVFMIIMNHWNHKFRFNIELTRDIRNWFPLHFPENETGNETQDVKVLDPKSDTSLVEKIVLSRLRFLKRFLLPSTNNSTEKYYFKVMFLLQQ